jgi:hypothetical protein
MSSRIDKHATLVESRGRKATDAEFVELLNRTLCVVARVTGAENVLRDSTNSGWPGYTGLLVNTIGCMLGQQIGWLTLTTLKI